jgi:hypothetical protein
MDVADGRPGRPCTAHYAAVVTQAAVVLVDARPPAASRGRRGADPAAANLRAALAAGFSEVLGVVTDERAAAGLPEEATLLLDEAAAPDESSSLRVALDYCAREGYDSLVVALLDAKAVLPAQWAALGAAPGSPVLRGRDRRGPLGLVRLEATVWSLLPLDGPVAVLWRARPELASDALIVAEAP